MVKQPVVKPPNAFQTFGELLAYLRKRAHLTQDELGRAVGYSRAHVARLESNQRLPSQSTVAARFVPALDLDDVPELAQRLIELASTAHQPRTNLPAPLTSFIGREAEITDVHAYLRDPDKRLITLIGPPGIGKTRLSLQVAHDLLPDFVDGVFFAPLAPVEDPDLVAPTIVQTLGLVQTDLRSTLDCLKSGIHDRQMLIVLDNFEQIIDAAPLTTELLRACPNLKIMVTSRESLRVPGEWLYLVPPLVSPDETQLKSLTLETVQRFSALNLFAERARAVRPDFALTPADTLTVAGICRQLDGLPLAIELIASRVRLMSPRELSARLTSDFKMHADGMRGVPPRQKTLHHAIAWSYDLLSREEQTLLARLGVFAGGFTLEAAQAITGLPNALGGVMSLLDKSLLVRTIAVSGETRFSQLEMMRDFARDRLRERGEEAASRDRHAAYFLDLAEQADRAIYGPDHTAWMDRLEIEHSNLLATLAWLFDCEESFREESLRMAAALGEFWRVRGHWAEGLHWLSRALAKADNKFRAVRARLLLASGPLLIRRGQVEQATQSLQESLTLYQGEGDKRGTARALEWLGVAAEVRDDIEQGAARFEQSLALSRELDDKPNIAILLVRLGFVAQLQGDVDRAAKLLQESLSLAEAAGDKSSSAFALRYLGWIALARTNLAQAAMLFRKRLMLSRELNEKSAIGHALIDLGELARVQGDYAEAASVYEESMQIFQELGATTVVRELIHNLGYVALHQANNSQARMLLEQAITQYPAQALSASFLTQARALFAQALTQYRDTEDQVGLALCLRGLAGVASTSAEFEKAARLFGAAEALLEPDDKRFNSADQAEYRRYSRQVLCQLDTIQFEALQAAGRALTLDQAIALALS